jgi:GMP synthase-like glutamine amidotransferase
VRALVIGHDHIGGTGHVGTALTAAGWRLEKFTVVPAHRFTRPDVEAEFPIADGYDLVLTLGAPWPRSSISTWAGSEVDFLSAVHDRGTPILGICAGAQFLAEALGGACTPLGAERVGWHSVRTREDAVPSGPWFEWHADRIEVPADAEVIADSDDGPEVFRVGSSVGVQFHPEMSAALLDRWLGVTPIPDERAAQLRLDAAAHEQHAPDRAHALLRGLHLI